ncbi:hypothetical protein VSS37_15895 [Candidatus Thiothrix sp. Deng01]|uniref:Uncharacterized protein n=1 Tax=Candidatus Thiothrix phosphatis TaxID=3112415 RepID=A0ABU6D067_9GAMM|nr:hypothetical protein [Candidatus Thiothrix sp. Deng01]MEB4592467.1 hypothetical protein [Candidatus Thiothrix sp. Deng01]
MAGKLDLALTHFSLGEFDESERLLLEVKAAATTIPDPAEAAKVLETINSHLDKIPQLRKEVTFRSSMQRLQPQKPPPKLQVAASVGVGDNVNGGLHFDTLTFGVDNATYVLAEKAKAHGGSFTDVEAAYQHDLPASTTLDGTFRLMGSLRDNHLGAEYDLGTLRGGLDVRPKGAAAKLDTSIVLSGGSFYLGGGLYRQDMAFGTQILPKMFGRKVKLSYQLTDSDYKTVEDTDSRFHKVNLSVPLTADKPGRKFGVGLDVGYQWPESSERLANYQETSVRLRVALEPRPRHAIAASYGYSQQRDAESYAAAFGKKKRNLEQQVLDIGWSWPVGNRITYEANFLARKADSSIKLFETSSVEATAGVRWELD